MIQWAIENAFLAFIIVLCFLWAFERMMKAFINRNKPVVKCDCVECDCECCTEPDDEDEDEDS